MGERRHPGLAVEVLRAVRRWRTPRLARYAPRSTLELPAHRVPAARVPAVDFHTHLGRWLHPRGDWMEPDVGRLVAGMDATNVVALVNLDGRWGRELEENLDRYDRAHPGRFHTFCQLDWRLLDRDDGPERLVAQLQRSVAAGARGLKVWKDLGLAVEARGRRVLPDDPMLAPVWAAAGAAGVPVLVHVADPVAFFLPADRRNERLEEMLRVPRTSRHGGGYPAFRRLVDALEHVVAAHPGTEFVAAHGCYAENLAHVGGLMDRYPNFAVDIAGAANSLGRQPRTTRSLVLRHPDRVLFGSDAFPMRTSVQRLYFRMLETDDEAFAYSEEPAAPSGRWEIHGLDLPPAVLAQVYFANAARRLGLAAAAGRGDAEQAPTRQAPTQPARAEALDAASRSRRERVSPGR